MKNPKKFTGKVELRGREFSKINWEISDKIEEDEDGVLILEFKNDQIKSAAYHYEPDPEPCTDIITVTFPEENK